MNKIIIDEYEKELNNFEGIIEIKIHESHIHLSGNNKISNIIFKSASNMIIDLEDNTSLIMNVNWNIGKNTTRIIINSNHNTVLNTNMNIEVIEELNLNYIHNIFGNNNQSHTRIHALSNEGTCRIKTIGDIKENTHNNEYKEELKGLTNNASKITFFPDLLIKSDDVVAIHNATIKCFDKEEIFYLKSKGINELEAKKLIQNGFLNKQDLGGDKNES